MRKAIQMAVATLCVLAGLAVAEPKAMAQQDAASLKNAQQARDALDAMVKALGGDAWLHLQNREIVGTTAAFYHGKPSSGTTKYWEFHQWPDHDRLEITEHRDYVQIFTGREGWEIIYSGKKPLPAEQVEDYLRRRDHSIETVIKQWLNDPKTILIYEGQQLAERHLADQVTLISAQNESVTILMDSETHLPLKRTFQWRDPLYKDKNEDSEEYAGYRTVDGFPTAYNITRYRNGDMVGERFILKVSYNQQLAPDLFNVDATAARIVKK